MKYDLILKVLRQIDKIVMYTVNKKTICNVFKKSYECFEWFGIYISLCTNYIYTTHSKHS